MRSGSGENRSCRHRFWGSVLLVALILALGTLGLESPLRSKAGEALHAEGSEIPAVEMVRTEGEAESYWPRWRGPSGQGVVDGTGYPDRWSDQHGILWRVEVPGQGNSSPVVWKDRVFLTTAYGGGEKRSVLCFRRADGRLLWETSVPEARPEQANRKNGYASGTPCTDGKRVYAYFGNHGLVAVDLEGELVWHQSFGEMDAYHGTACSPLLHDGRVIIYQDHRSGGNSGSFVAAFDAASGRRLWRTPREESVGWGSPIAVRVEGHDEIIVSGQNKVHGYEPKTGSELWQCSGNLVEVIPTPVAGQGHVFVSSGRAGPTLAIRPGGRGDVTTSHVSWRTVKGSPFVPSALLLDGLLYMVNDMASVASCYEASTGRLLWQGRLGLPKREGFSASPVAVDGKIFFTNDLGETYVLRAGREFDLMHVNQVGERVLASPALVDRKWYLRTDRHLICIGSG